MKSWALNPVNRVSASGNIAIFLVWKTGDFIQTFRFFLIPASVDKAVLGLLVFPASLETLKELAQEHGWADCNDPSVPCIRLPWGTKKERIIPFLFTETKETASGFGVRPLLHQSGNPNETVFPTQEDIHRETFALLRAVAYPDGQKTATELRAFLAKKTGWIPGDHLVPIRWPLFKESWYEHQQSPDRGRSFSFLLSY